MVHNIVRLRPVYPGANIMASDVIQATLAPPGAGLPRVQAVLLRRLLFPLFCHCTSWDRAVAVFRREGDKVLRLAAGLPPDAFRTRVLIRPLWGIEDGFRYWSAEMVFEHLIESGVRIATTAVDLSRGESPAPDIVEIIPNGGRGLGLLQDYRAFLDDFADTLSEDVGDRRSKRTHPHPWLGELTAHRWVCLGARHQAVHRRQLEAILTGLHYR